MNKLIIPVITLVIICAACGEQVQQPVETETASTAEAVSLLGEPLYSPEPSPEDVTLYESAKADYENAPGDADALIWYGRRTGYLGRYNDAIAIFTEGIAKHPLDARMYRHRGHRYISIRKLDEAIADFEKAAELIAGTTDEIEPDGKPNARNIPVSSLHSNIWYHLGLAYYLKDDMDNALRAYRQCAAVSANPDNVVSSTHWLYMILRRLGRDAEAAEVLDRVTADMDVIENASYHKLCLLYKGELSLEEVIGEGEEASSNDAESYGIGNWYYYNGNTDKAREVFQDILANGSWPSFGYIAAEADMARMNAD